MQRVTEQELLAWRLFIKTHSAIIDYIEQELADKKRVPLTTYDVLIALFEAPGKQLRLGELNRKVILSKSGLTRLLDRLEREKLIVRHKSAEDGRGSYAALTEEGESKLREAWPVYARGIKQYFAAPLSGGDVDSLIRMLESIQRGLQAPETPNA